MRLFDLTGRVAIVTGGNGGIGLGIACGLAEAGATVAITGRNAAKGAEAVATLKNLGGDAVFIAADVAMKGDCARMAETVAERFGGIDILVNNAGIHVANIAAKMTLEEWDADFKVNLTGAFLCCQAVYPFLVKRGGGKIIAVASVASYLGQPYAANYAATKGGAISLTKALAIEWAGDNIQVNAILPGLVLTEMTGPGAKAAPEFDAMVRARTPAKRWGAPDDYRGVGVFLASSASDFVTGATIVVDGGYSVPLY